MKTALLVLALVPTPALAQGAIDVAQAKPTSASPTPAAVQNRPELTPGPRPLTKREQEMLRDTRRMYVAQAKNDFKTFFHHMADEHYGYDEKGALRTKETWRKELTEMAAKNDSTIRGDLPNADAPALVSTETLLIADNTAILTRTDEWSADGKNWVPVKHTSVWIYRDGRWQVLTGSSILVTNDGAK